MVTARRCDMTKTFTRSAPSAGPKRAQQIADALPTDDPNRTAMRIAREPCSARSPIESMPVSPVPASKGMPAAPRTREPHTRRR
jgi:hypothetical protein